MIQGEMPQLHAFSYLANRGVGSSTLMPNAQSAGLLFQDKSPEYLRMAEKMMTQQSVSNVDRFPELVKKETKMANRRVIQVYIADPDDQIPVGKSLLYKSEPQVTDLTDQELFYEIELPKMLKEHNDYRVTLINKKVKDRIEHLEPIRIKDLSMLVITLAEFRKP